jgi:hypothetical protein
VSSQLPNESRRLPVAFWSERLPAGRLLEYEFRSRLRAARVGEAPAEDARHALQRPALEAFRLAMLDHLRLGGSDVALATVDRRMAQTAEVMGFTLHAEVVPLP